METLNFYQAQGWKVVSETKDSYKLKKRTSTAAGHILILIVLGWWTLGIANLLYHAFGVKYLTIPK